MKSMVLFVVVFLSLVVAVSASEVIPSCREGVASEPGAPLTNDELQSDTYPFYVFKPLYVKKMEFHTYYLMEFPLITNYLGTPMASRYLNIELSVEPVSTWQDQNSKPLMILRVEGGGGHPGIALLNEIRQIFMDKLNSPEQAFRNCQNYMVLGLKQPLGEPGGGWMYMSILQSPTWFRANETILDTAFAH